MLIPTKLEPQANEISLAFIDDVVHLVAHTDTSILSSKIEQHGQRSLEWGTRHGAIFDKKKTNLMFFTNKKKFTPVSINFGDLLIQPQQKIRWLGFWLDPKLKFCDHISTMRSSGKNTIHQLRRIGRCFSGLNPEATRNLVVSVLQPRILFGSVVWLTMNTFSQTAKIWNVLLNSANRLILGAFRTSPVNLMRHDTQLTPFHIAATKSHYKFLSKRFTAPENHPSRIFIIHELTSNPSKHQSCITHRVDPDFLNNIYPNDYEVIRPYADPPWSQPTGTVHNLSLSREEVKEVISSQIHKEKENNATVIFTDGSFSPDIGCGAAAVTENKTLTTSIGPRSEISNNEAELIALGLAIRLFINNQESNPNLRNLSIFSDSQSAIKALHETTQSKPNQYIVRCLKSLIQQAPIPINLNLYWVPGHEAIELNEKADEEAKEAAQSENIEVILSTNLSTLKRTIKSLIIPPPETFHTDKPFIFKTPSAKIWKTLAKLEKGRASVIFQLRSGHIALNAYLFKHSSKESITSPNCDTCRVPENTDHFLIRCRRFQRQRNSFHQAIKKDKIKINPFNSSALIDCPDVFFHLSEYVLQTNRFPHFKSFVDEPDS